MNPETQTILVNVPSQPASEEFLQAIEQLRHQDRTVREEAKQFLRQGGTERIAHLIDAANDENKGSLHRTAILKVIEEMRMEIGIYPRMLLSALASKKPERVRTQAISLLKKLDGEWLDQGIADPRVYVRHQLLLHTVNLRRLGLEGAPLESLLF